MGCLFSKCSRDREESYDASVAEDDDVAESDQRDELDTWEVATETANDVNKFTDDSEDDDATDCSVDEVPSIQPPHFINGYKWMTSQYYAATGGVAYTLAFQSPPSSPADEKVAEKMRLIRDIAETQLKELRVARERLFGAFLRREALAVAAALTGEGPTEAAPPRDTEPPVSVNTEPDTLAGLDDAPVLMAPTEELGLEVLRVTAPDRQQDDGGALPSADHVKMDTTTDSRNVSRGQGEWEESVTTAKIDDDSNPGSTEAVIVKVEDGEFSDQESPLSEDEDRRRNKIPTATVVSLLLEEFLINIVLGKLEGAHRVDPIQQDAQSSGLRDGDDAVSAGATDEALHPDQRQTSPRGKSRIPVRKASKQTGTSGPTEPPSNDAPTPQQQQPRAPPTPSVASPKGKIPVRRSVKKTATPASSMAQSSLQQQQQRFAGVKLATRTGDSSGCLTSKGRVTGSGVRSGRQTSPDHGKDKDTSLKAPKPSTKYKLKKNTATTTVATIGSTGATPATSTTSTTTKTVAKKPVHPVKKQPPRGSRRGGVTPRRVPSVWRRIPAFRGTTGMTWEGALRRVIKEDVRKIEEDPTLKSLRRHAIRQSWMNKMIDKLDEENDEQRKREKGVTKSTRPRK